MITSTEWLALLADGAISATLFLGVSLLLPRFSRAIFAIVLIVAALAYIFFVQTIDDTRWLLVEVGGVAIYGTMGLLGIQRSPWWLVAGWGLHPLWDVVLHFVGPGHAFAPVTYTIPCLSFDLLVAVMIACGIIFGWKHFRNEVAGDEGRFVDEPI
jgi:hypothetical protein